MIKPPERRPGKNQILGALPLHSFQFADRSFVVRRWAVIGAVFLEEWQAVPLGQQRVLEKSIINDNESRARWNELGQFLCHFFLYARQLRCSLLALEFIGP